MKYINTSKIYSLYEQAPSEISETVCDIFFTQTEVSKTSQDLFSLVVTQYPPFFS